MKLKDLAKPKEPPVPAGTHPCVCFGVVDLGDQLNKLGGRYQRKLRIMWEVADVKDSEGKPRELSREFTATFDKRGALRPFLVGWLGIPDSDETLGELEVFDLIGVSGFMNVVLNETAEYSNIAGVIPFPPGYQSIQMVREPIKWDMEQWDDAAFKKLPEWIQERIKKSTQYQKDHPPKDVIDFAAAQSQAANSAPVAASVAAQASSGTVTPAAAQNATAANGAPSSAPAATGPATPTPINFADYAQPAPAAQPQSETTQGGGVPF